MSTYAEFLHHKARVVNPTGIIVEPENLHPSLFPHQVHAVQWAARTGRAGAFLDTGLGKTAVAIEWARSVADTALIVCPLSVAHWFVKEGARLGVEIRQARNHDEVTGPGLWVTNYEMQDRFKAPDFGAVVLDESAILRNHTGAMRNALVDQWAATPYRLACTATPTPNDTTELANHSEFLGAMTRVEMLAAYFVHDADGWRPKGHAVGPMYEWMSTWAIAARRPSDLGPYDDSHYVLPPLRIHAEIVECNVAPEGQLFATSIGGVSGRSALRRATMDARIERAVGLLPADVPAIAWCGLNPEAAALSKALGVPDLHGSLPIEAKVEILDLFTAGEIPTLVTKPSIAGMGLNLQRAARQVFVGLGDSWDSYYQAIRRSWRFGQDRPVDIHVVVSELEQQIVENVRRKETEAAAMTDRLVRSMRAANDARSAT